MPAIAVLTWNGEGAESVGVFAGLLEKFREELELGGADPEAIVIGLEEVNPEQHPTFAQVAQRVFPDYPDVYSRTQKGLGKAGFVGQHMVFLTKPGVPYKKGNRIRCGGLQVQKGVISGRLNVGDRTIVFLDGHLPFHAGDGIRQGYEDRLRCLVKALNDLVDCRGDDDYAVVMGDLNFRIQLSSEIVLTTLGNIRDMEQRGQTVEPQNPLHRQYIELQQHDQLMRNMPPGYVEGLRPPARYDRGIGPLFGPTCKLAANRPVACEHAFEPACYDVGTARSPRVPSWCDRILYRSCPGKPEMEATKYMRISQPAGHGKMSDHDAVGAVLEWSAAPGAVGAGGAAVSVTTPQDAPKLREMTAQERVRRWGEWARNQPARAFEVRGD